jgi:hypothetical protein
LRTAKAVKLKTNSLMSKSDNRSTNIGAVASRLKSVYETLDIRPCLIDDLMTKEADGNKSAFLKVRALNGKVAF